MKSNLTEPQFNILITIPKDPGRGEAVDETHSKLRIQN